MNLAQAEKVGVTWEVEALEEMEPVVGNALASGDDDADREEERRILEDYQNGNDWAWCCIKVTAHFGGHTGYATRGSCSYKDREDFETDGPLEDMKKEALDSLLSTLQSVVKDGEEAFAVLEKLS